MTIANFDETLKKYAELTIKTGVNLQKGQEVVLYISVTQQKLAHLIIKEAYKAGASNVMVKWDDVFTAKQFLENADEKHLTEVPNFKVEEANYIADNRVVRISVLSEDPAAFAGVDEERIAKKQASSGKALRAVRLATQNNDLSWTIIGAADYAWAKQVFPDLDKEEALDALWKEIFKTARVDNDDPIAEWERHAKTLQDKAEWLNQEQFSALKYKSPRTDLTIGLPKNHVWAGAGSTSADGVFFMPNMPTEEVFTSADNTRIDGYVTSTKPLSYSGSILENMRFTFKDGKVIEATADKGQKVLNHLLATDEGAKSLGEVSLVPDPSPISQSGIIFYNTLYDENASDHLALGASYPFNIEGGTEMTDEELASNHMNISQTHVDFMMGSADMDIDGIKEDGSTVPVFRNGDWV
ncbi:aminopeptidase [Lactobacillus sp. S2-2]|uniref:aminopeptidase n=1 Tax=Lactobacillus sp. S2-2 TaxID=2692917 RepID=UPI001F23BC48|nr:aminopeptidase [Lactobacillus sp. S2-2]MCF6514584.1 aminopeptidase [Lactobacillus sp. S2-2]